MGSFPETCNDPKLLRIAGLRTCKECCEIPLTIGARNPSSIDKESRSP